MEIDEKEISKQKLGLAIQNILSKNKKDKDRNSINSLRKLAASSGIEYSIIQKISTGKRDPQFTTILAIADGLGISASQFLSVFESIQIPSQIKKKSIPNKRRR